MAYMQKARSNSPQPKSLTISDFSGGLNNRATELALNEASDMLNMRFTDGTLIEKRWGSKLYKEPSDWSFTIDEIPNTHLQYIDEYKSYTGAEDCNVYITKSAISLKYAMNSENSGKDASFYNLINPGLSNTEESKITGTNFMGLYVFGGAQLGFIGKTPTKESTYVKIMDSLPGNLATDGKGMSKYAVHFQIQSPPAASSQFYKDNEVYFKPLGTTHKQGHLVYWYAANIVFYVPCENELNDPYLGRNVVPVSSNLIEAHQGRLYVAGVKKENDSIYLSQVNNPYYFPAGLGLQLTPNSDQITGLKTYDGGLVVTRFNDIHVIKGITNNPELELDLFTIRKLNTHTGCPSNRTLQYVYEYLFYLGTDGEVYTLATIDTNDSTLASSPVSAKLDLTKPPFNFKLADFKISFAKFYKDEYHLGIQNKYVIVFNYTNKAWTVYEGMNATCFSVISDQLVWGALPVDGSGWHPIHTWDKTQYTDRDIPFKSVWQSGFLHMGDAVSYKLFKEYFITKQAAAKQNDLQISFEVDTKKNVFYDTNHASAIWGTSQWGDRHVNEGIIASDPVMIGERGRTVRIRLSSGDIKEADIKTVQTEADLIDVTPKVPDMLVKVTDTSYYYSYKVFEWKKEFREIHFNQPIKIYQINLTYETKGRR